VTDARTTANRLLGTAAAWLPWRGPRSGRPPDSPLNAEIGEQRRFGMTATSLDDYKRIRKTHGGTINDVVLGCRLRRAAHLAAHAGRAIVPSSTIRAMVPVSVRADNEDGSLGNRVSSYFRRPSVGSRAR